MTEETETGWNLLLEGAEVMAKIGKMQNGSNASNLSIDYDPLEKSGTDRRTIRVHDTQLEWAEHLIDNDFAQSREMLYSACVAFAQHNQVDFRRFLIKCEGNGFAEHPDAESNINDGDTDVEPNEQESNSPEKSPNEHKQQDPNSMRPKDMNRDMRQDSNW